MKKYKHLTGNLILKKKTTFIKQKFFKKINFRKKKLFIFDVDRMIH